MTGTDELTPVRGAVERHLGLSLASPDADTILRERVGASRLGSAARYAALLEGATGRDELRVLARLLTVGETYFYRNEAQLAAFSEVMLPACVPGALARGRLRLLSAGCSTGEEAYTLALIARGSVPAGALEVTGVDMNPAALDHARRGAYSAWSLRQVSAPVRRAHFTEEGGLHRVDADTRGLVRWIEHNLLDEGGPWCGAYDVILFRNVAMYLTPDALRRVVDRCAAHLAPGGFLVLGDAETLRGVSNVLEPRQGRGAYYYQRPAAAHRHEACAAWFEEVARSSARVERLTADRALPAPARRDDVGRVLDHIRADRWVAAHDALDALPSAADADPEVLLLRAVVSTNRGLVADAERACRGLLERGQREADVHYLLALCREQAAEWASAAAHDRRAIELDPTFAMPRLHLARLARREGDDDAAHDELRKAGALLRAETERRLVLFGGGFTRDALVGLCAQAAGSP